jgi:hypothetical protein
MSVRQKKALIARVTADFKEYNLPKTITMEGYSEIVADPLVRRGVIKNFKSWGRLILAIENQSPDIFKDEPEPVKGWDKEPQGLEALAALTKGSKELGDE